MLVRLQSRAVVVHALSRIPPHFAAKMRFLGIHRSRLAALCSHLRRHTAPICALDFQHYLGLGDIFAKSLFPRRCIRFIILQVHEKHSNLLKRLAPGGRTDVPKIKPESDDI